MSGVYLRNELAHRCLGRAIGDRDRVEALAGHASLVLHLGACPKMGHDRIGGSIRQSVKKRAEHRYFHDLPRRMAAMRNSPAVLIGQVTQGGPA